MDGVFFFIFYYWTSWKAAFKDCWPNSLQSIKNKFRRISPSSIKLYPSTLQILFRNCSINCLNTGWQKKISIGLKIDAATWNTADHIKEIVAAVLVNRRVKWTSRTKTQTDSKRIHWSYLALHKREPHARFWALTNKRRNQMWPFLFFLLSLLFSRRLTVNVPLWKLTMWQMIWP